MHHNSVAIGSVSHTMSASGHRIQAAEPAAPAIIRNTNASAIPIGTSPSARNTTPMTGGHRIESPAQPHSQRKAKRFPLSSAIAPLTISPAEITRTIRSAPAAILKPKLHAGSRPVNRSDANLVIR